MKTKRNVYLQMKTLDQAREIFLHRFPGRPAAEPEPLSVVDAVGRVLAEPVFARICAPNYHGAAMDGVAVRAEYTFGANEHQPLQLTIGKDAFYVNTGEVLPAGTDGVIMIENVQVLDDERIEIEAPAFPWQHVRRVGEDIVATEMLFARNHQVTPYCVGALLSGGVFSVAVNCRPRVLIIPTGAEIVDWRELSVEQLEPGMIIESNASVLGKLVERSGGYYVRHDRIADDVELISTAILDAVRGDYDVVLVIGGSSAGARDMTKRVIEQVGEVLVHGVTIMPGKPTLLAEVEGKPVVGMPGYPVSTIVAFEQFVGPLLRQHQGLTEPARETVSVKPTRKIASKLGLEEFVRVKLGKVDDQVVATPLPRGAGTVTSLTQADGIIRINKDLEGLRPGQPVMAELLRPLKEIEKNLVVVGSHDNTLDVLADLLRAERTGVSLSSSHVGSFGGLMAIKKNACHLAGCHLLDEKDGSYNLSYVRQHLPEIGVKLVHLVMRQQGLMVRSGNPLGIAGIADLARSEVTFINRQGGSGTRVLLDYELDQRGLAAERITGYRVEEFTHMAVAVAVLSGAADAGLGILAAAQALGLDFIPVVQEQYDLIIPERFSICRRYNSSWR